MSQKGGFKEITPSLGCSSVSAPFRCSQRLSVQTFKTLAPTQPLSHASTPSSLDPQTMLALSCSATLEKFSRTGSLLGRTTKHSTIVDFGQEDGVSVLNVHLNSSTMAIPLLPESNLHTSFVHTGRMTVQMPSQRMCLLISNSDALELTIFATALCRSLRREDCLPPHPLSREEWDVAIGRLSSKRAEWNDTRSPQHGGQQKTRSRTAAPCKTANPVRRTLSMPQGDARTKLSQQQEAVVQAVLNGQSLMFTGGAGTGKSTLLQHLLKLLPSATTSATASTGISAFQLGGTTIHAFAGVGQCSSPVEELILRVRGHNETADRWRRTKALVIDEVSMIDAPMWDKLEAVARAVRGDQRPFGGIQLVVCGDFFQLPPVERGGFCFEAESWRKCIPVAWNLGVVFRQTDKAFVNVLNELRVGTVSDDGEAMLRGCVGREFVGDVVATKLYARKCSVDAENEAALEALPGPIKSFYARDSGTPSMVAQLSSACRARAKLCLKIGAQVLLIKNIDVRKGLQNGARGVVMRYTPMGLPVVRFLNGLEQAIAFSAWPLRVDGREVAMRHQIPLDLAWALSIHKSIGMTLDRAEVSLDGIFESGQAYVSLSRIRRLGDLRISHYSVDAIRADRRVIEWYRNNVVDAPTL